MASNPSQAVSGTAPPPPSTSATTTPATTTLTPAEQASLTTSTTISSMADLKKKAPTVYKSMMEGIAMNICNDMQKHQDRLKQIMRQGEQQS